MGGYPRRRREGLRLPKFINAPCALFLYHSLSLCHSLFSICLNICKESSYSVSLSVYSFLFYNWTLYDTRQNIYLLRLITLSFSVWLSFFDFSLFYNWTLLCIRLTEQSARTSCVCPLGLMLEESGRNCITDPLYQGEFYINQGRHFYMGMKYFACENFLKI